MKPQKKGVVGRKSVAAPNTAKKRRASPEKLTSEPAKRDKKTGAVGEDKKSRKPDKSDDCKKRLDKAEDKRKAEKFEDRKKIEKLGEERKKIIDKVEERKRISNDKPDEKRNGLLDKIEELKRAEELKRKIEKQDDKKKTNKDTEKKHEKTDKIDADKREEKLEAGDSASGSEKKNSLPEEAGKSGTSDKCAEEKTAEENSEITTIESGKKKTKKKSKVTKKGDGKKSPDKENGKKTSPSTKGKKETKPKQPRKKTTSVKRTILVKKIAARVPVTKKLTQTKMKLVKNLSNEDSNVTENAEPDEGANKSKKRPPSVGKGTGDKKPQLAKQMKSKTPPRKYSKINSNALTKKEENMIKLAEKMIAKKKNASMQGDHARNSSVKEDLSAPGKISTSDEPDSQNVKQELVDSNEDCNSPWNKSVDVKKVGKSSGKSKATKKVAKKCSKATKARTEHSDHGSNTSDEVTLEDMLKQSKSIDESEKSVAGQSNEENTSGDVSSLRIDLKVENDDKDESSISTTSDSEDDNGDGDDDRDEDNDDHEDEDEAKTSKSKKRSVKKRDNRSPSSDASSERARRMRLFGFWSGPKRHRVASLNALAKVHCMYENEAGGVYLGGYCKPKPEKEKMTKKAKEEKEKEKEKDKDKESKEKEKEEAAKEKEKDKKAETNPKVEEMSPKRKLRNVPGLRGKHWDMMESSSSSSSSDEEQRASEERKNLEANRKKVTKRRKKNEEVMDLKDMVVCKRMASLNASAILAASYSDEKYHCRGSSSSESSSDSEVEVVRRRKHSDSETEKRKSRQGSDPEETIKQPNKVVILNQDTDVTITGVYVNQTRSTHHEGFCSIAGMQYRISSTSHTQTAATAVATEILEHPKPEQPCKSYTPLGALSSMQPPGSQGPPHPPMSPRRHSAFSAPHQHGYYQPAGPLIQHPPTLPPVKAPPPEPTPTPPQNSEGSDDLVATSTTSGGTTSGGAGGGSFYRAYCPQYYGTPPQYQELCYPPTYSHPHSHPPPYYKYAPTYRRQYYGYQESTGPGGGGSGGGGSGGGPGVVEYQPPPPPPAEYPPPPYYGGYPPPPPPPPPPGNPAYMHPQGRPFVDHAAFQGCPCPMQSCPKNVDTGPLIGNGKGAPVGSGPGLSLPPSTLVGPPSPARGLAGLAPPHGANAWDTDRVQINNHRNLTLNQPPPPLQHNGGHIRAQNQDCRTKEEKSSCQNNKMSKCNCQKHACTSTCEVKTETLSPNEKLSVAVRCPNNKLPNLKIENNNVKCESCSEEVSENIPCESNCNVKCESGYKCEILECEQCVEGQMAILDIDKDSGILLIDDKLEGESVKEEINDVVLIDHENWKKPDYESTVRENVEEKEIGEKLMEIVQKEPKCQKVTKRKLSLDSLSDNKKKRKINKRTLSVGSVRDLATSDQSSKISIASDTVVQSIENVPDVNVPKKKYTKKDAQNKKRKSELFSLCEPAIKKSKTSKLPVNINVSNGKQNASETSIMETISSVIEESLQITQKNEQKFNVNELTDKKKIANLLATIKRVAKKPNVHKTVPSKISVSKITELKNGQSKTQCEVTNVRPQESKLKSQDPKLKTKVKNKILNAKPKIDVAKSKSQDVKSASEVCKQIETISKAKASEVINDIDIRKPTLIKNRRKSTKKTVNKKACTKSEETLAAEENLALIRRPSLKPKWSNGWSWEGEPYEAKVYLTNEESAFRRCYTSMRHVSGDVLKPRDCVLLKSGPRKADLPFVAKIAALWENPHDGEMMFSLLWYYRPEHTEQGRTQYDTEDEVFASRHRDANSVACIEDKCYVLTFNEYCRYRKDLRRVEEGLESPGLIVPPGDQLYPRVGRLPPIPVPADIVLFCRRVYDYRGKKLVKNPG